LNFTSGIQDPNSNMHNEETELSDKPEHEHREKIMPM
jgi:hypothetical protein